MKKHREALGNWNIKRAEAEKRGLEKFYKLRELWIKDKTTKTFR